MATIIKTIGTGKDYSTITAWINDLTNTGIYSSGDDAVGLISVNQVFNENVIIQTGVAGLNSVTLTVDTPYRHTGVKGTGARIEYSGSNNYCIHFNRNYPGGVHVKWLEVHRTAAWTNQGSNVISQGVSVNSGDRTKQTLSNLIVTATGNSGGQRGCGGINAKLRPMTVTNCIVYDILNGPVYGGFNLSGIGGDEQMDIINCTVYNVHANDSAGSVGIGQYFDSSTNVKNCAVFDMHSDINSTYETCILGTPTQTTNATSDATGTSGLTNLSSANVFKSLSPVDLHLKNNSLALNVGTNLGTSSIDIDGFTRPTSSYSWDIGADEYTFPLNLTSPVLATDGTVTSGTWDSQSNGTISRTTYLRLASDDSLIATLYVVDPDFSSYVTSGLTYYVIERAENDGGYDAAEDTPSADATISGGGADIEATVDISLSDVALTCSTEVDISSTTSLTIDDIVATIITEVTIEAITNIALSDTIVSAEIATDISSDIAIALSDISVTSLSEVDISIDAVIGLDNVSVTSLSEVDISSDIAITLDNVIVSSTVTLGSDLEATVNISLNDVDTNSLVDVLVDAITTIPIDGVDTTISTVSDVTSTVTIALSNVVTTSLVAVDTTADISIALADVSTTIIAQIGEVVILPPKPIVIGKFLETTIIGKVELDKPVLGIVELDRPIVGRFQETQIQGVFYIGNN